ncbi:Desosaminyl transferase EryCIII precursor [compost metagenome]
MPMADAVATTDVVLEALVMSGRRAVLAAGWGGLGGRTLPDNVHLLDSAPHDQLFPLMSAVVHHGGAGTTAAGLRAGKPTVICPFFGDQPFWGRRVAGLGVGPAPVPFKHLTPARLSVALDETEAPRIRAKARSLGEKISAERGVDTAIAFIERSAKA